MFPPKGSIKSLRAKPRWAGPKNSTRKALISNLPLLLPMMFHGKAPRAVPRLIHPASEKRWIFIWESGQEIINPVPPSQEMAREPCPSNTFVLGAISTGKRMELLAGPKSILRQSLFGLRCPLFQEDKPVWGASPPFLPDQKRQI